MKRFLITTLACISFGGATIFVYANDAHHPKAEVQKSYAVKGEVVVVDKATGKVKLKHEAVPELEWPGMTMDFKVKDKAILKGINPGQKVVFEVVKEGPGKFYVNRITPLK